MKNWMLAAAGTAVWLAACSDHALAPRSRAAAAGPSFAVADQPSCPAGAAFTVTDEATLLAALGAATAGTVIAVDGLIEVGTDLIIATDGITLTCATPGSGIRARAGAGIIRMITVTGKRVTVEGLVLDGANAAGGPYRAFDNEVTGFAEQPRLLRNRVTCGVGPYEGGCALFDGTRGAVVADNHFESAGSLSGLHMQVFPDFFPILIGNINGSQVLRNTVVATGPSPFVPVYGGLRIRDGVDVVIADNVVIGPWSNSASIANLAAGAIERNRFEGAQAYGLRMAKDVFVDIATARDKVRNNIVREADSAGVLVAQGCNNDFIGNNVQHNSIGLIFEVETGANRYSGNPRVVVDHGNFDCDGDGVADPNVIRP